MKIKLFKPYITGKEIVYINDLISNRLDMSGDGKYTKKVQSLMEKRYKVKKVLLTTSGTTALEMAVRLLDLKKNDEVIAPSFTFSSTINAILLSQGAKVVFADVKEATLNINPIEIEKKITKKTKAIMIVHYAGVACDMDEIMLIAKKYKLKVIEDAAQAIESKYKNKYLGTIGDFGCLSFHDTKNITCGEGGALFINSKDKSIIEKAEIMREKGTNRSKFFRGEIDKYTWVDIGSSYLPSDILSAYLYAQMEDVDNIINLRLKAYKFYQEHFSKYKNSVIVKFPTITKNSTHNAHIFYLLLQNEKDRNFVLDYLRNNGVMATFHYIPLHSAPQGKKYGYKASDLPITESVSKRLIRLPLYSGMKINEMKMVVKKFDMAILMLINKKRKKEISIINTYKKNQSFSFRNLSLWQLQTLLKKI